MWLKETSSAEYFKQIGLKSPEQSSFLRLRYARRLFGFVLLLLLMVCLFLPWNQNVRGKGYLNALAPDQRPQAVQTIIAGQLQRWYVQEGDFVRQGDTIAVLTEVKESYLDPELVQRTAEQLDAKNAAVGSYQNKAATANVQIDALEKGKQLKLLQLRNKIQQTRLYLKNDSASLVAAATDARIAQQQYNRQKELFEQGLKSQTELEQRTQQLQNAQAKQVSAQNKVNTTRQELDILELETAATEREYAEKIAKASGDRYASLSEVAAGSGDIAKLRNQLKTYEMRQLFYVITAPQAGQLTKTLKAGIGEIVKEGEKIAVITPPQQELAAEIYISPLDLPLIQEGQHVQLQFDGIPSIVFTGWPKASYGLFKGTVAVIDNVISDKGEFRLWVLPAADEKWPEQIRTGGGVKGFILLETVPIWYELWRQFNGFPPNFYQQFQEIESNSEEKSTEKPEKLKIKIK